ncbi:Periplasmic serine endoprotease DegP precursor [Neorhodopirellula pilleata]|uniref:Periplasmic serine endoprotease DegP n=2 Tax=Neorhodopirellula pilleata TaxID=2714738 RepID=A0A5C6A5N8_9BACT|nr:Periplasmic serine endoprotease DegP precursor [Neorhodopirellula pilleata]
MNLNYHYLESRHLATTTRSLPCVVAVDSPESAGLTRWPCSRYAIATIAVLSLVVMFGVSPSIGEELHGVTATSYRGTDAEILRTRRSPRETPTVTAIRRASPSVVNLHGQKTMRPGGGISPGGNGDVARQVNGMGTGVVIDPRGYVVTNYHVVEDVQEINVTLHDGKTTRADLVASDPRSDLAVVKLRGSGPYETVPRGHSDDLMIGETVIAIGNAFGYVHTSTVGIISALHRDIPVNETQSYHDLIQTSAGINPGNSGGPLLNIDGEIIGINVAVRVGAQQIAFAIPIDQVLETVTEMVIRHNDRRFVMGMRGEEAAEGGFRVVELSDSGSAFQSGLKPGDRVLKIEEESVQTPLNFALGVLDATPGQKLRMEFERDGEVYETFVATLPSSRNVADPVATLAWQVIGVAVRPAGDAFTRRMNSELNTSYRGGLMITDVRKGSAADEQGMRVGDVLLGIHSWQTSSLNDLAGILEHPEIQSGPKAKFYIVRRDQTLYGHMQLASQTGPARR